MNNQLGLVFVMLGVASGCGAAEEEVVASQEGVVSGGNGVGIMTTTGLDFPEYGLAPDDVTVFIRSYDPQSCGMPMATDVLSDADSFAWVVFLSFSADDLFVGKTFYFGGNDCLDESCGSGFSDSVSGHGGPAGISYSSGLHCGDPTYDQPSTGEIVAVGETSITIEIHDLCFTDYGPIATDLSDDPADDLVHRADGRYEISLCSEAASRAL